MANFSIVDVNSTETNYYSELGMLNWEYSPIIQLNQNTPPNGFDVIVIQMSAVPGFPQLFWQLEGNFNWVSQATSNGNNAWFVDAGSIIQSVSVTDATGHIYSQLTGVSIAVNSDKTDIIAEPVNVFATSFRPGETWTMEMALSGNDSLTGGVLGETLYGYGGSDRLEGGFGADALYGDGGASFGNDVFVYRGFTGEAPAGELLVGGLGTDAVEAHGSLPTPNGILSLGATDLSGLNIDSVEQIMSVGTEVLVNAAQFGAGGFTTIVGTNVGTQEVVTILNAGGWDFGGLSFLNWSSAGGDILGLVGTAGLNDTILGTSQRDVIVGRSGNDLLYARAGNDALFGDEGSDSLWGGLGADQHIGGNDVGAVDYARYDDANYGNLTIRLDNPALNVGAAAVGDTYNGIEGLIGGLGVDTMFGNNLANNLFGLDAGDALYGLSGADYLNGGAGSDSLWGGLGADVHIGGNDVGAVDYARYDDANYGNLTIRLDNPALNVGAAAVGDTYNGIEGLIGGLGADTILGNNLANNLFGGGAGDFIDGLGGSDYLNGGAAADRFRFSTTLGAGNVDRIADFAHLTDDILLAKTIFAAIGASLTVDELRFGTAAADANDFIIYNSVTGALFYDANGSTAGGAGQIQFATVTAGTTLTSNDFVMV